MGTRGCGCSGERWKRWSIRNTETTYLKQRQSKTELSRIDRELKRLKTQIARLEERKSKLIADTEGKRPRKF